MDASLNHHPQLRMGRYLYVSYERSDTPRFLVVWSMHWIVIEVERIEPSRDLSQAMTAAIDRLGQDGWQAECDPIYGFTFIRSSSGRRLLMITARDPYDGSAQSFNPHRDLSS